MLERRVGSFGGTVAQRGRQRAASCSRKTKERRAGKIDVLQKQTRDARRDGPGMVKTAIGVLPGHHLQEKIEIRTR